MNNYFVPATFEDGETIDYLRLPTEVATNPSSYCAAVIDCYLNFTSTKLAKDPIIISCNRVRGFMHDGISGGDTIRAIAVFIFPDSAKKMRVRPNLPTYIAMEPHRGTDEIIVEVYSDKDLSDGIIVCHFRPV